MRFTSRWSGARVRAVHDVARSVRAIDIEPEDGAHPYPPGSHLTVAVMIGDRQDTRSYSLVGDKPVDGAYRIAVKHHEDSAGGSRYMWSLEPGARLMITEPQNLFELTHNRPDYLLVAGGIGITPIVGMAAALDRKGAPLRLCYAGRSRADMPFLDDLAERLGDRLTTHVSEEGTRLDLAAAIDSLHPDGELYLCGPIRLLDEARRLWAEAGRPPSRLRYETFASGGRYAPEPFEVTAADHGVTVTVPENRSMLEALRDEGVEIMYDCLRGECGLCAVTVLEVDGEVDHRDVFLSDAERAAGERLCSCVSRVVGGTVTIDTGFRPASPR
jgi:ferredoxin-NADP reductase